MMSVFWYYRPDDVEGINISDFQEVYTYCLYYVLIQILVSSRHPYIVLSKQIHRVDINVCHRVSTSLQQLMWSRSNRYNR